MNIEGEEEEMMMMEEKQEDVAMTIEEAATIILRCVIDNYRFRVAEVVALKIPVIKIFKMKNKFRKSSWMFRVVFTHGSLEIVMKYLCNLIDPSNHPFDFHDAT